MFDHNAISLPSSRWSDYYRNYVNLTDEELQYANDSRAAATFIYDREKDFDGQFKWDSGERWDPVGDESRDYTGLSYDNLDFLEDNAAYLSRKEYDKGGATKPEYRDTSEFYGNHSKGAASEKDRRRQAAEATGRSNPRNTVLDTLLIKQSRVNLNNTLSYLRFLKSLDEFRY